MNFDVVTLDGPRPTCAKPEHLPLVDAAFAKPGGPEAKQMRERLCTRCPVGDSCLAWAMTWHEDGIWGGSGPKGRTQHGAPGGDKPRVHMDTRITSGRRYEPKAAVGVPVVELRAWALEQGLPVHPRRGKISEAIREAYDAAHAQRSA